MRLFDTHCHFERADPTVIAPILERARAAGVARLMAVGGSPALNEGALLAARLAAETVVAPQVVCAVGLDREQVGKPREDAVSATRACTVPAASSLRGVVTYAPSEASTSEGAMRAADPLASATQRDAAGTIRADAAGMVRAIGEIGLDYHYSPETREAQLKLFAAQLDEARAKNLPVVIHTREAAADTIALLKEIPSRGIIHCFTGAPDEARAYLDLGFFVSFSGIVTFRMADNVRASARVVPDDRILIETDSPFLAPVPLRGQPNEPAFVRHTCEFLAKERGMSAEDFAALTFANGERALTLT